MIVLLPCAVMRKIDAIAEVERIVCIQQTMFPELAPPEEIVFELERLGVRMPDDAHRHNREVLV